MAPDSSIRIRSGKAADAVRLARLHVTVWRETYGRIAPPEAFLKLDEARRLPYWRGTLASDDPTRGAIVADHAGELLGVLGFGPPKHKDLQAAVEITHLYVLPEARGTGLGKRLMAEGFARFRALGLPDVALAVVRENAAARRFYAAMGGTECGAFTDAGPLWRSANIVVRWPLSG